MKNKIPLHIAVESNLKEMVEILLSKGSNINARDFYFQCLITKY